MRLMSLALIAQIITFPAALAADPSYTNLKCMDVARNANWAHKIVGWMDLRDMAHNSSAIEQLEADAKALEATCSSSPHLHLHAAASFTFYELDSW